MIRRNFRTSSIYLTGIVNANRTINRPAIAIDFAQPTAVTKKETVEAAVGCTSRVISARRPRYRARSRRISPVDFVRSPATAATYIVARAHNRRNSSAPTRPLFTPPLFHARCYSRCYSRYAREKRGFSRSYVAVCSRTAERRARSRALHHHADFWPRRAALFLGAPRSYYFEMGDRERDFILSFSVLPSFFLSPSSSLRVSFFLSFCDDNARQQRSR